MYKQTPSSRERKEKYPKKSESLKKVGRNQDSLTQAEEEGKERTRKTPSTKTPMQ
jgi:hypothetical protein